MTTDGCETDQSQLEVPDVTGFGIVTFPIYLQFWRNLINVIPPGNQATWSFRDRVRRVVSGVHPGAQQWSYPFGRCGDICLRRLGDQQLVRLQSCKRSGSETRRVVAHLGPDDESVAIAEIRSYETGFLKVTKRATIDVLTGAPRTLELDTTADRKWITDGRELCLPFFEPSWVRFSSAVSNELAVAIAMFCIENFKIRPA